MGSRDRERVPGIVPVRIWGITCEDKPFSEHVCTLNISGKGARLRGVRASLAEGDFIGLQYRSRQARFQIVWISTTEKSRGSDVGLQCLEPEKDIWQADLPEPAPDLYVAAEVNSRRYVSCEPDRRLHTRYPVSGEVCVTRPHGSSDFAAKLGDVSLTGCYVQTCTPLESGCSLSLLIKIGNMEIRASGVVRVQYAGVAMGIEFTHLHPVDLGTLRRLVMQLQAAEVPPSLLRSIANPQLTERA